MPKVPILMPQLGDSIAEATVLRLLAAQGDTVEADQEIFEVETNKATMGVTTMCGGILSDVFIKEGESVVVGACMAMIEATEEEIERSGATPAGDSTQPSLPASPESVPQAAPSAPPREEKPAGVHFGVTGESYQENGTDLKVQPSVRGLPVPAGMKGAHYMSPRMKARMDELGMSASDIAFISGSGAGGRVTIDDLEEFLEYVSQWPHRKASSMRLAVADAMRRSWTRPLASAGRPVFMDPLIKHRQNSPLRPGITLYFARALALALAESPECAGYLVGENILSPKTIDIGIAAQVADGVMVPVLRRVNERTMEELLEDYNRLIAQARRRRLAPEDSTGGIATVTNFGGFGLTFAAPMPMPSESIILGVGAVTKTPVWSDEVEAFIPISKANIVATGDHRVVDGADIGRLLSAWRNCSSARNTCNQLRSPSFTPHDNRPARIRPGSRRRRLSGIYCPGRTPPDAGIAYRGRRVQGGNQPRRHPPVRRLPGIQRGPDKQAVHFPEKARRKERYHGRRHQSEKYSFPPSGPSRPFRIDAHAGKKCGLPAWGRHHGSGKGRLHHPPGLHLHGGAHAAAGAYRRTSSHA